jgi:hypothetical protein
MSMRSEASNLMLTTRSEVSCKDVQSREPLPRGSSLLNVKLHEAKVETTLQDISPDFVA